MSRSRPHNNVHIAAPTSTTTTANANERTAHVSLMSASAQSVHRRHRDHRPPTRPARGASRPTGARRPRSRRQSPSRSQLPRALLAAIQVTGLRGAMLLKVEPRRQIRQTTLVPPVRHLEPALDPIPLQLHERQQLVVRIAIGATYVATPDGAHLVRPSRRKTPTPKTPSRREVPGSTRRTTTRSGGPAWSGRRQDAPTISAFQ